MINLTDLETFIAYFKNIATQNTTLLHNDATNVTFGVVDMIENQIQAKIESLALVLEYPEIRPTGTNVTHLEDFNCAFWLIKKPATKDFAQRVAVLKQMKNLANEIVARMLYDWERDEIEDFQKESVSMNKIGPYKNDFYGWRVEFTLTARADMSFDESKWNDIA